ncbi:MULTISPECIES: hypothetical protein [Rhodopseudomonas]|uniref:hypothetical protein n=1 Tax=Rhodopseudomonas pseudopalustris TaxID=1513892 RepID=UPI0002FCA143
MRHEVAERSIRLAAVRRRSGLDHGEQLAFGDDVIEADMQRHQSSADGRGTGIFIASTNGEMAPSPMSLPTATGNTQTRPQPRWRS